MFVHWVRDCGWYLSSGWIKLGLVLAHLWSSLSLLYHLLQIEIFRLWNGIFCGDPSCAEKGRMNWVTEASKRTSRNFSYNRSQHNCLLEQGTMVYLRAITLMDFSHLFFFLFQVTLTWGNFLHLVAGGISLANLFISWGRGLLIYPYCNVNIVSYTLFTCGGKCKRILNICNHLLHRVVGTLSVLCLLSPLREEWWLLGAGGNNPVKPSLCWGMPPLSPWFPWLPVKFA